MEQETEPRRMGEAEYVAIQQQALLLARLTLNMDIDGALRLIDDADTMGPLIDPTLWMRKRDDMMRARHMLEALRPFAKWAREFKAEIEANQK